MLQSNKNDHLRSTLKMEGSVSGPQPGTPTDVKCQMISIMLVLLRLSKANEKLKQLIDKEKKIKFLSFFLLSNPP